MSLSKHTKIAAHTWIGTDRRGGQTQHLEQNFKWSRVSEDRRGAKFKCGTGNHLNMIFVFLNKHDSAKNYDLPFNKLLILCQELRLDIVKEKK